MKIQGVQLDVFSRFLLKKIINMSRNLMIIIEEYAELVSPE